MNRMNRFKTINLTPPKRVPPGLSPWAANTSNWRKSFLKGKKPKKSQYWHWSFMNPLPGWGWSEARYRIDMDEYYKRPNLN